MTQTVARNYARDGVLAYVVAPGIVRTRMAEISATARGGIDAVNAILAMGEMAPAEEVGELIAFLASGACRHLTGADDRPQRGVVHPLAVESARRA